MTLAAPSGRFGAGGADPWGAVLRGRAEALLELVRADHGSAPERMDPARWLGAADAIDRAVLEGLPGPLLDVGCGPGRMIRAALDHGLDAWGLDADDAAIAVCRTGGLPVLRGDVFDRLPREGRWGSIVLLDGNVGIGGDVEALLARCARLLRAGGLLLVEAHPDGTRDATALWRLRGADGLESDLFPWSQAGAPAIVRAARGFMPERTWTVRGRTFVRLRRREWSDSEVRRGSSSNGGRGVARGTSTTSRSTPPAPR